MGLGMNSSSGSSTTNSSQTTQPWTPSIGPLTGLLNQIGSYFTNNNFATTPDQAAAIGRMSGNGYTSATSFNPSIDAVTKSLLAGGGALDQAPKVQAAYDQYEKNLSPIANNTDYNPYDTPGFSDAIKTQTNDITNNVNGSFAAAGRDFSGANQQALGRGIMQGTAPTIANQYNSNVANQQAAAGNLYQGGVMNAGILAGLQQQFLANQQAGINSVGTGLDAKNAGDNSIIQAEAQWLGIPMHNLGMFGNLAIPIGGLGSQSVGHSQTNSSSNGFSGSLNLFSDRRLKEDITQVGTLFDGTPVYRYRYKGHKPFQIGLIAQDLELTHPDAVGEAHGFKTVDYKLATERSVR